MEEENWINHIPTVDKLDLVVGTPVRFVPGKEPPGFNIRDNMCLTVRPWGDEHETHCLVIDDRGTSMPVRMDSLVIDLKHPLGFCAVMLMIPSGFTFDVVSDEGRRMLAVILQGHCCGEE